MGLIYTGEDSQKRGGKKKTPNHECLAWISEELIALRAFQASASDRMGSSSKYTLPAKVHSKGTKAIHSFPFFSEPFAAPAPFPWGEITEPLPCPADRGILQGITWIRNERKACICPVNEVVFPAWSSKLPPPLPTCFVLSSLSPAHAATRAEESQLLPLKSRGSSVFQWEGGSHLCCVIIPK